MLPAAFKAERVAPRTRDDVALAPLIRRLYAAAQTHRQKARDAESSKWPRVVLTVVACCTSGGAIAAPQARAKTAVA